MIVTMGCGDTCPGKRYKDGELTDPAGQPVEVVRRVRDEIEQRRPRRPAGRASTSMTATTDPLPMEDAPTGDARRSALPRPVGLMAAVPRIVRRLTAEFVGTAFLVAGVVGSGIMAQRLTDDRGLQLLQNAAATAGVLVALILALGPASGAHFNPAVTLVDRAFGGIETATAALYIVAQVAGAIVGAIAANAMFDLPLIEWSTTARSGGDLWLAEGIATLGLLMVIFGVVRSGRAAVAAFAVAGYIAAAYYFTSSTSFANPAVTIGRAFSDTFAGIEPASVPMFIVAQLAGALAATGLILVLYTHVADVAADVVVPHGGADTDTG